MMTMHNFWNYLGQLRLYSLVDLLLLLAAANASVSQFGGVVFLWLGFLLFLENRHRHTYRQAFPAYLWPILYLFGLILYQRPEGLIYLLLTFLYTKKTERYLGLLSPVVRGLQNFVLVGGIIGYEAQLTWIVLLAIIIRNFLGDLRDVQTDRDEGIRTLPAALGFKKSSPYIHLAAILVTSFIWWKFSSLPIIIVLLVFLVEITTYFLTPRASNPQHR